MGVNVGGTGKGYGCVVSGSVTVVGGGLFM